MDVDKALAVKHILAQRVVQGLRAILIKKFGSEGCDIEYEADLEDKKTTIRLVLTSEEGPAEFIEIKSSFQWR